MTLLSFQDERLSFDDFLTLEMNAPAEERWELIAGRVWRMMAGASLAHAEIVQNVARALDNHLRARRPQCRVYVENARVNHAISETSVLPDIVVRCGPRKPEASSITDPVVIIEVLSPSTEARDRGVKWTAYQMMGSLAFHAVIDQRRLLVETNTRVGETWSKQDLQARTDRLSIPALDFAMPLDEIYDGVVELQGLG